MTHIQKLVKNLGRCQIFDFFFKNKKKQNKYLLKLVKP